MVYVATGEQRRTPANSVLAEGVGFDYLHDRLTYKVNLFCVPS